MIVPADRIVIDGDTGWWVPAPSDIPGGEGLVLPIWAGPAYALDLDRPCEPCEADYRNMVTRETHDCIDGRYTFDIEVASRLSSGPDARGAARLAYRVSIVPGMVLPIHDWMGHDTTYAQSWIAFTNPNEPGSWLWDDETWTPITLPSAAAPGMWAVQLRVSA
jgi:hypothetical protein